MTKMKSSNCGFSLSCLLRTSALHLSRLQDPWTVTGGERSPESRHYKATDVTPLPLRFDGCLGKICGIVPDHITFSGDAKVE